VSLLGTVPLLGIDIPDSACAKPHVTGYYYYANDPSPPCGKRSSFNNPAVFP